MPSLVSIANSGCDFVSSIGQSLGGSLNQGLGMLDKYKDIEFINYNPFGMKHLSNKLVEKGYQLSNNYSNITNLIAQNEYVGWVKPNE